MRKCGGEDDFAVSRFRLRLRRRLVFSRSLFLFFLSTEKNALSDLILIHSFSSDSTFLTNYNCWLKIYCNIIGGSRGWGIEETKGPPKYAFQSIECVFPPPNGNVAVARGRCPRPPSPSLSGSPLPLPPSLIPAAFGGVGPRKITLYDRRSDSLNQSKYARLPP